MYRLKIYTVQCTVYRVLTVPECTGIELYSVQGCNCEVYSVQGYNCKGMELHSVQGYKCTGIKLYNVPG